MRIKRCEVITADVRACDIDPSLCTSPHHIPNGCRTGKGADMTAGENVAGLKSPILYGEWVTVDDTFRDQ